MPSAAYEAWLQEGFTDRVILCEPQVREILSGWAAAGGGLTNTYAISFALFVQTSLVQGGLCRRLDGVTQNATALSVRASAALVDANPGSYFLDTTGVLYVHTTTSVNPDIFAAMLAVFTVFLGTTVKDFVGGPLYEPRLTGVVPDVQAEAEDPLFGVKVYPSGDVELANGDGLFDSLVRAWVWKNGLVTVRFGGGSLALTDYETIAVMVIEDMAPNDRTVRLKLRAVAGLLDRYLPFNTFGLDTYPNLGDGLEGTYLPILYGAVTDIPGLLVDDTAGAQVYLIADPAVQTLFAVAAVRAMAKSGGAVTTLTPTTHYTVSLTGCAVTVTSLTYVAADYDIRIDATGTPDGAGSYLKTFGSIVEDLLLNLGATAAQIDAAAVAQADLDDPAELAYWMRDGKTAATHVRLLEQSVLGSLTVSRDGLWTPLIWSPGYAAASLIRLTDEDFVTWDPDDKIDNIFYRTRVRYAYNPATGSWPTRSATDDAVRYAYQTTDTVTLDTCLVDGSQATVMAQRYRLIAGTPTVEIDADERGLSLMTAQVFDKVFVTRGRAPTPAGAFNLTAMEILGIRKTWSPVGVHVRLGDLRGFGAKIGHWADSGDPDWASTPIVDRGKTGYWSDANGWIDPADAATKDRSLWW